MKPRSSLCGHSAEYRMAVVRVAFQVPDAQNSTLASEESDDPSRDGSSASF